MNSVTKRCEKYLFQPVNVLFRSDLSKNVALYA